MTDPTVTERNDNLDRVNVVVGSSSIIFFASLFVSAEMYESASQNAVQRRHSRTEAAALGTGSRVLGSLRFPTRPPPASRAAAHLRHRGRGGRIHRHPADDH